MKNFSKNIILWVVIGMLLIVLFNLFQNSSSTNQSKEISFSDFLISADNGNISEVKIVGNNVSGFFDDGRSFSTYSPNYPDLVDKLNQSGVKIVAEPSERSMHPILSVLLSWFPMLLLIGVWIFFMRQMQSGGGKAMGFGKSKAKLLNEAVGKVTFDDVAGIDEAKQELEEVVEFLKDPKKFSRLGGKIPTGALLVGPPGTGKTLLARAIAGEANVPFFSISGSDFVEMFVGVGASRVRDMFEQGKKNAPCIIFIDEIDAVGRHRGAGLGGGNDEREQTLNQLLTEMDGFSDNCGVILLAATNRPDVLDSALMRPGRFDRRIYIDLPDKKGRYQILSVHARTKPLHKDVSLNDLSTRTPGFSGADLENLLNEAAIFTARTKSRTVKNEFIESALERITMGLATSQLTYYSKRLLIAYHEIGHALIAAINPLSDKLDKISMIPRNGGVGGFTRFSPDDEMIDSGLISRGYLYSKLVVLLGGRAAETIIFGSSEITQGAITDLENVTNIARQMVTSYGFSKLGPISLNSSNNEVFLGRDLIKNRKEYADNTSQLIDMEIRSLANRALEDAINILKERRHIMDRLAVALMEEETLSSDRFYELANLNNKIDGSIDK